jgi:hypothetical protein
MSPRCAVYVFNAARLHHNLMRASLALTRRDRAEAEEERAEYPRAQLPGEDVRGCREGQGERGAGGGEQTPRHSTGYCC